MKGKNYLKIGFIVSLILCINHPIPSGIVVMSAEMVFEMNKRAFYYRVYNEPFSEQLLKECIYYEKILHSEIVLKQSQLETGYYTSELFLQANNCFGMRLARVRETTAIGEFNYHAKYSHWSESVKDYKLFQDYYESRGYNIETEYLTFLYYIRYATDYYYIAKLNNLGGDVS